VAWSTSCIGRGTCEILGDVRTKFCVYRNPPAVTSVFIGELGAGADEMSHAKITHVRIDGH